MNQTEAGLFRSLLFGVVKCPFIFILFLAGKRRFRDAATPWLEFYDYVKAAKFTFWVIVLNILAYTLFVMLYSKGILNDVRIEAGLVSRPSDLWGLDLIPVIGSWFLHINPAHLIGNMAFLFIFGRAVEKRFGPTNTAFIYFGSALIADIFRSLIYTFYFHSNPGALGASGAIAGLAAVGMLASPFAATILGRSVPLFLIGWGFLAAEISGVLYLRPDNIAHLSRIGGFFAVTMIAFFLSKENRRTLFRGLMINTATALAIFIGWFFLWQQVFAGAAA